MKSTQTSENSLGEILVIGDPHAHFREVASLFEKTGFAKVLKNGEEKNLSPKERKKIISIEQDDGSVLQLLGLKEKSTVIFLGDLDAVGTQPIALTNLLVGMKENPAFAQLHFILGNHDRGHLANVLGFDKKEGVSEEEYLQKIIRMTQRGKKEHSGKNIFKDREKENNGDVYIHGAVAFSQHGLESYAKKIKFLSDCPTSMEFTLGEKRYILAHSRHIDPRKDMEHQHPDLLSAHTIHANQLQQEMGAEAYRQVPQKNEVLIVGHESRSFTKMNENRKKGNPEEVAFYAGMDGKPLKEKGLQKNSLIYFLDTINGGALSGLHIIPSKNPHEPPKEKLIQVAVDAKKHQAEKAHYTIHPSRSKKGLGLGGTYTRTKGGHTHSVFVRRGAGDEASRVGIFPKNIGGHLNLNKPAKKDQEL